MRQRYRTQPKGISVVPMPGNAGGHYFMRTPIGDALVVYALPKR